MKIMKRKNREYLILEEKTFISKIGNPETIKKREIYLIRHILISDRRQGQQNKGRLNNKTSTYMMNKKTQ